MVRHPVVARIVLTPMKPRRKAEQNAKRRWRQSVSVKPVSRNRNEPRDPRFTVACETTRARSDEARFNAGWRYSAVSGRVKSQLSGG